MADKAQVQEAIKIQGEVVRKLKSEKASKDQVSVISVVIITLCFKAQWMEHVVNMSCTLFLSYHQC